MKLEELFSVKDKIVLVTGGSRGIGEMIAEGFIANGAKVYITSRKENDIKETATKLKEKYGGTCEPISCDISNIKGIEMLFEEFSKKRETS